LKKRTINDAVYSKKLSVLFDKRIQHYQIYVDQQRRLFQKAFQYYLINAFSIIKFTSFNAAVYSKKRSVFYNKRMRHYQIYGDDVLG